METISIISIILAIGCMIIIIMVGILTDLLREAGGQTPYSFSRFQLWLWTLVISPAFVLNWGFNNNHEPSLNQTCLILLGISAAISLTSGIVTNVKISAKDSGKLKKDFNSHSFWTDILIDDSEHFSIVRLQQLVFTLAYVIIFISSFFSNNMIKYPEFDEMAFTLMGISGGTYLVGKGLGK